MSGYDPVDLTGSGNAGLDVIDTRRIPPIGNVTFAHSSPVYVSIGDGEWSRVDSEWTTAMLTQIQGGIDRLRSGRHYPEDRITHHHAQPDHQAFLERPFVEALERVCARFGASGG